MGGFYSEDDSKIRSHSSSDSHSFYEFFRAVRLITRTIQEKTNWSLLFFFPFSSYSAWYSSENGISLNKILFELFSLYFHPLYYSLTKWYSEFKDAIVATGFSLLLFFLVFAVFSTAFNWSVMHSKCKRNSNSLLITFFFHCVFNGFQFISSR